MYNILKSKEAMVNASLSQTSNDEVKNQDNKFENPSDGNQNNDNEKNNKMKLKIFKKSEMERWVTVSSLNNPTSLSPTSNDKISSSKRKKKSLNLHYNTTKNLQQHRGSATSGISDSQEFMFSERLKYSDQNLEKSYNNNSVNVNRSGNFVMNNMSDNYNRPNQVKSNNLKNDLSASSDYMTDPNNKDKIIINSISNNNSQIRVIDEFETRNKSESEIVEKEKERDPRKRSSSQEEDRGLNVLNDGNILGGLSNNNSNLVTSDVINSGSMSPDYGNINPKRFLVEKSDIQISGLPDNREANNDNERVISSPVVSSPIKPYSPNDINIDKESSPTKSNKNKESLSNEKLSKNNEPESINTDEKNINDNKPEDSEGVFLSDLIETQDNVKALEKPSDKPESNKSTISSILNKLDQSSSLNKEDTQASLNLANISGQKLSSNVHPPSDNAMSMKPFDKNALIEMIPEKKPELKNYVEGQGDMFYLMNEYIEQNQ